MIAMKGSPAVPFITAFPKLILFDCRNTFETVLFLLCFTFTDCSLRRGRGWGWVGLICRKQWLFFTAVSKWKEARGAGDVCLGT